MKGEDGQGRRVGEVRGSKPSRKSELAPLFPRLHYRPTTLKVLVSLVRTEV